MRLIGSVLGVQYEVLRQSEETPLFTTYVGRSQTKGDEVTLRVIREPYRMEREFMDRLRECVRVAAEVRHPGVEPLLELDAQSEPPYIVSAGVLGPSLKERLHKLSSYSPAVSVATAIGVLEGLNALHRSGIVHGEVSSTTVRIGPEGDAQLALPGVWHAYSGSDSAGPLMLPFIAPYLAPEVSRGSMPSPSSDLYAVGALLYEMLTGRHPFTAETPVAMAAKHITDSVPSARMMNPATPHVLDEIIRKAMAKDPAERYSTSAVFLADLRAVQDALRFGRTLTWPIQPEPVEKPPAPPEEPKVEPARKRSEPRPKPPQESELPAFEPDVPRWLLALLGLFAAVLVLFVGWWGWNNMSRPKELTVPELKRLSVAEAKRRLQSMNLSLQVVKRETSEEVPIDHVLRTNPAAGDKIFERRSVQAVVSVGTKYVEVPDLKGMSVDRAKTLLASLNLDIADRVVEVQDEDVEAGLIVGQDPEPRDRVERFTPIRVRVSTGAAPEERDPEADAKYLYTVTIRLTDIDTEVELRVDMTDSKGTKTVHRSLKGPGETVEVSAEGYGQVAKFRIYYDGEMVKEVEKKAEE